MVEKDLTAFNPAGRLDKTHDGPGGDRFAAATLSDYAEGSFWVYGEGNSIDGANDAVLSIEIRFKISDIKEWHVPSSP
jgi:hypothetical protein